MQKFFARVVEGTPDQRNDLVSYLLFDGNYCGELIELGYHDGTRHAGMLDGFIQSAKSS